MRIYLEEASGGGERAADGSEGPPPPAPCRRSQPKIELRRSSSGLHSFSHYHFCPRGHCKSSSSLSTSHLLSLEWHYSCRYHYLDGVRFTPADLFIYCPTSPPIPLHHSWGFCAGPSHFVLQWNGDATRACLNWRDSQVTPCSHDFCLSLFTWPWLIFFFASLSLTFCRLQKHAESETGKRVPFSS